jgi:hypothetical protein
MLWIEMNNIPLVLCSQKHGVLVKHNNGNSVNRNLVKLF